MRDCQLFLVLQGIIADCTGTNLDDVLYVIDKDFAVADMTGISYLAASVDNLFYRTLLTTISTFVFGRRLVLTATPR